MLPVCLTQNRPGLLNLQLKDKAMLSTHQGFPVNAPIAQSVRQLISKSKTMKLSTLVTALAALVIGACEYDVPITTDHDIPINRSFLGTWEAVPQEDDDKIRMQVLEFSDTEYLVHYFEGDESLYFRAYQIKIENTHAIQLELIGDDKESIDHDKNDRFMVASVRLLEGKLEVRTLNTELVSAQLADSQSLKDAFIANIKNPELFNDPGFFRRPTEN
jgi:preprotein translocase subunit SecD